MKKIFLLAIILIITGCSFLDTVKYRDLWVKNNNGKFWENYAIIRLPRKLESIYDTIGYEETYTVMKLVENGFDYSPIFSLQKNDYDENTDILIGTSEDLFIFQKNNIIKYSIDNEKRENKIKFKNITNNLNPLGIDDNWIYINYKNASGNDLYFKIDTKLEKLEKVEIANLPTKFDFNPF